MMQERNEAKLLRSGPLAEAAGVSPDTIRHYEKLGVLPRAVRTAGGYRLYPASAIERIRVVQAALSVGFSLAELAEVLTTRDRGGIPCHRVYELAREKLHRMESEIEALQRTQRYLKATLEDWERRMQRAPGERAHLLHSLHPRACPSGPQTKVRRAIRK